MDYYRSGLLPVLLNCHNNGTTSNIVQGILNRVVLCNWYLELLPLFGSSHCEVLRWPADRYHLYDVATDPLETRNLATERPELVRDLEQKARRLIGGTETQLWSAVDPLGGPLCVDVSYTLRDIQG